MINTSKTNTEQFQDTAEFARQLDQNDSLKEFRNEFFIPQYKGSDKIYFTGNSLGLQPKAVKDYLLEELEDWAAMGGEGHLEARRPWLPYHENFPDQLAAVVGCLPDEVVAMNSLTVNLHLLMVSFYRPTGKRFRIICEERAFSSDQYAMESQVRFHGYDPNDAIIEVNPREGEDAIQHSDIIETIRKYGDSIALVLFSGINYYTGQVFNMKEITKAAHDAGAIAGFDLAHAAGNIKMQLHDWNVDFACWCTYKYLNSGPGSVGGVYIHRRHAANKELPRFAGWWGHDKASRFRMEKGFQPIATAEGWQISNAPVLSMAAHKASLDIFAKAGMEALDRKGKMLSAYLIFLLEKANERLGGNILRVITPKAEEERGCQVSFVVRDKGKQLFDWLMAHGVSAGWREPEVIRVAPVPLYNSFEEVWQFVDMVEKKLKELI